LRFANGMDHGEAPTRRKVWIALPEVLSRISA
jgi:hypothetical protein